MKKNYFIIALILFFSAAFGQELELTLSADSVCAGTSVTATVDAMEVELATPLSTSNNNNGAMFDVTATNNCVITGFEANPLTANSSFEVYYRTGSFVGHENSSTGWTLLGSSTGIPTGMGNIGVALNQTIVAGQTLAFYITCTGSTQYIYYVNGTSVGTTLASDANLTIKEGVGKGYPFGSTNTTRNFVGKILYKPEVTNISWNVNNSTNNTATFTPARTMGVVATGTVSGLVVRGHAIVKRRDLTVDATATPPTIQSGQSSSLTSNVKVMRGLGSTFAGGNNQDGAMFDVTVKNNIDIKGFSMSFVTGSNTDADIEIFYKTGTHVGFESNAGAWTSILTKTGNPLNQSVYFALPNPISAVAGQTLAFYVTRTDGDYVEYTNATAVGSVFSSDENLAILDGKGIEYPFGTTFSPRMLNTVIHYEIENPSNVNYSWSPGGGSSGSKSVSPASTTTYTLTATSGGCSEAGTVTVTVGNIGVDEEWAKNVSVYPNPATDFVSMHLASPLKNAEVTLMDVTGKKVYTHKLDNNQLELNIPVSKLAFGLYILQVQTEGKYATYKVNIQ